MPLCQLETAAAALLGEELIRPSPRRPGRSRDKRRRVGVTLGKGIKMNGIKCAGVGTTCILQRPPYSHVDGDFSVLLHGMYPFLVRGGLFQAASRYLIERMERGV